MRLRQMFGAAAILVASAGIAAAAPAVVQTDLNLRAGPGTGNPVVAVLSAGETVDVVGSTGGWCRVASESGSGYASCSYLAMGGGAPAYAVSPYVYDDDYYVGSTYYGTGAGVYFGTGPRWQGRNWRGREGNWRGNRNWRGPRDGRGPNPGWAGRPGGGNWGGRQAGPNPGMMNQGGNRLSGRVDPRVNAGGSGGARMGAGGGGGGGRMGAGGGGGGRMGGGAGISGRVDMRRGG